MEVILQRLNEQYPETPVPLDHRDPFTLLIAVLLSAQCTDKKVNEVTPALFAAGPGGKQRRRHLIHLCLLYTSPSPRDKRQSRMPSSA